MGEGLQLAALREQIDTIDKQILELLTQRSACVQQIAQEKCEHKRPIYDAQREAGIIRRIVGNNPTQYQDVDLENIHHMILRAGLNQQLLYRSEQESE